MKPCEAVDELLSAHLLGSLAGSEASLVEEHLAGCSECRAAQTEITACWTALSAPPCAPPPAVWQGIQARIGRGGGDDPVRDAALEAVIHLACSFCRGGLTRAETLYCASCLAPHHGECFAEYGRCSVMGCGEQRVVRPLSQMGSPVLAGSRPRGLWPLVVLLAGGLSAAAALSLAALSLAPPGRVGSLARPPHHRSEPGEALFQLDIEEATLGEVAERIASQTGLPVEFPESVRHRLISAASWRGVSRDELLAGVAARLGLEFAPDPSRLTLGPASAPGPEVPDEQVVVDRVQLLSEGSQPEALWEGRAQRVLPAPSGIGVALATAERLYLYLGLRQIASAEGATLASAWAPDGRVLAAVLAGPSQPRLVLFWPGGESPEQRELTGLAFELGSPGGELGLAWLEDALVVADARGLQKVSLAGQVTSFGGAGRASSGGAERASSGGAERRRLWGLGEQRFLLQTERALELWDAAEPLAPTRYPAPSGFELSLSWGPQPRALLAGPDEVSLLELGRAQPVLSPLATLGARGARSSGISRSGAYAAWIDGGEGYVRSVAGEASLRLSRGAGPRADGLRGVRWGPGERLVYWSDDAVYRLDAAELNFETGLNRRPWPLLLDPGRVRGVEWSAGGLIVTTERTRERRPRVRLARVD